MSNAIEKMVVSSGRHQRTIKKHPEKGWTSLTWLENDTLRMLSMFPVNSFASCMDHGALVVADMINEGDMPADPRAARMALKYIASVGASNGLTEWGTFRVPPPRRKPSIDPIDPWSWWYLVGCAATSRIYQYLLGYPAAFLELQAIQPSSAIYKQLMLNLSPHSLLLHEQYRGENGLLLHRIAGQYKLGDHTLLDYIIEEETNKAADDLDDSESFNRPPRLFSRRNAKLHLAVALLDPQSQLVFSGHPRPKEDIDLINSCATKAMEYLNLVASKSSKRNASQVLKDDLLDLFEYVLETPTHNAILQSKITYMLDSIQSTPKAPISKYLKKKFSQAIKEFREQAPDEPLLPQKPLPPLEKQPPQRNSCIFCHQDNHQTVGSKLLCGERTIAQLRENIFSGDPKAELRSFLVNLQDLGYTQASLEDLLEKFREERGKHGEDDVIEESCIYALDMVTGWDCWDGERLIWPDDHEYQKR